MTEQLEEVSDEQLYNAPPEAPEAEQQDGEPEVTPGAVSEAETESAADPLEGLTPEMVEALKSAYDPETKKFLKRFDTLEAAFDGIEKMREYDSQRGRQNLERGQQAGYPPPQSADPLAELGAVARGLPSQMLQSQEAVNFIQNQLGYQLPQDANGYVDTSAIPPADLMALHNHVSGYVRQAQERQQQEAMAPYMDFFQRHPDVPQDVQLADAAAEIAKARAVAAGQPLESWDDLFAATAEVMRGIMPQQQAQTVAGQPKQPPRTLAGNPSPAGTAGTRKDGAPVIDTSYYFK
jgi:hypothetical protein